MISVGTTLTDLAGNAPLAGADSANYTIDTKEPVVSSVTTTFPVPRFCQNQPCRPSNGAVKVPWVSLW